MEDFNVLAQLEADDCRQQQSRRPGEVWEGREGGGQRQQQRPQEGGRVPERDGRPLPAAGRGGRDAVLPGGGLQEDIAECGQRSRLPEESPQALTEGDKEKWRI